MIVIDTSVWVEFLKGDEPVFSKMQVLLEKEEVLACEPVFAELMQGVKNKREREIIFQYWLHLPKSSFDGNFIEAGVESGKKKWFSKGVGLIDAGILLYAQHNESTVWTLDKKFLSIISKEDRFC